jgi:alpha-2-macroglobulin
VLRSLRLAALVLVVAALVPSSSASAQTPAPPHVVRFSPEGVVKGVRQVTARFSAPMVPLGDPRPAIAVFDVDCPEAGVARWIDGREWAYDFARDVPAGVRCAFRLRAGLTTLDGTAVAGRREFTFSTGGPAVQESSLPRAGAEWIDEEQAFMLVLDAAADQASVLAHTHFVIEGVQSRVGARILGGKDRESILASRGKNLPAGSIVIVQARQRFPNGARVTLVWGKGIATTAGVPTTEDQRLEFRVRPAFEVRFTCERERKDADCLPVASLRVTFSAPVPWAQASRLALVGAGGQRWKAEARDTREPLHSEVSFHAPFPERATLRLEMPPDLVDDANRRAVNAARFPLTVKTAAFPPLAKFAARFGILERADPVLPVTLRRLEPRVKLALLRADHQSKGGVADWLESVKATVFRVPPEASGEILPWLRRVAEAKRETSIFGATPAGVRKSDLPKPGGADAFEVIGLPLGRPGLYVVELESARLGQSLFEKPGPMFVPTAALVTNLAVHFKWGAENALVWVTALDRGRPVGGAKVTIQDCAGTVHWRGATDAQGLARVTGLPARASVQRCEEPKAGDDWEQSRALQGVHDGLLVIAQTPDDLGLVHSSWDDGIQPWRFNLPTADERGPLRVHTILDRPLFRAGETVHMKHVIRRPSLQGFDAVPEAARPRRVVLQHVGSDEKYELPLTWNPAGTAETTWKIPGGAKLGSYSITLVGPPLQRTRWMGSDTPDVLHASGTFRVEEFRLPTLRAVLRPPTEPLVDVSEVALDVAVTYLAGGGARRLPVTMRAQLQPHAFPTFEGFENFVFANGAVTEGVTRRARGDDDEDDEEGESPQPAKGKPAVHQRDSLTLDDRGTGKATVRRLPRAAVPRDLLVELEYRDPSGETQTAARRLPLWPASRLVGLVPEGGEVFGETLKAHAAVIDLAGKPLAGVPVTVEAFERKLYSHRKRLVGGFYAYEHVQEIRRLGELCRGTTSPGGMLICEGKAPATGSLILQARAGDERGRATVANADVWVVDPEYAWWFDVREHDRMDVLPERRRWEPGETARFQVRMPFREAQALVTTEREGVLDGRVVALAGNQPVIELPVLEGYAPNVFVSVLAVRGRVGGVQPTAFVDLGRPAFKLGLTEIRVGWRAHELKVTVTPERETYRVRERARVRVSALTAGGKPPAPGSEVAIAAVDEALLELAANPSWDLLPAMLARRGHALTTSTAQLHVVGKRHFGLKALPAGGGGGRQTTRELFDTLLYWNARVALDERGEATVEIPLNDSLTSFRVVAVATGGTGLFGTGAATFRATQDLMLLAGLPPLVRNGDRFAAEVTLRNATAKPMEVVARAKGDGLGAALEPRAATLAAGESRAVTWDVTVPAGVTALGWEIEGGERGGAMDRLRLSQRVVSPVPVRTYQATLLQAEAGHVSRQAVERPPDSLAGQGGVRVTLAPTLVTGIEPVREWMARYPYTCLEQEVSRAVTLRDAARWRALVERLPSHVDGDGLLKYFPGSLQGNDVLTAYVSAIAHEAGLKIPPEIEKKIDEGLAKFVEGKIRRGSDIPRPDLTLRKLAALEALARRGHADPKLVSTIAVEPNLWPTSGVLDWWSVLRRVYNLPQRATRLTEAEHIVRARLNVQGTTIGFSTEASDRLWWLMVSNDVNAVRLILTLIEAGAWRDEIPRLMRGALARRQRGAWDLTVANAWGTLAVDRFAREYEKTPVAGVTTAALGGDHRRVEWVSSPRGRALAFPWPAAADDVTIAHEGAGRPWATIETQAAIPLRAPLSSGYRIVRTVAPVERKAAGHWSRGDIVRIKLEVEAQADMTWVVIDDPIPSGASHLGRGLGGESAIAAGGERREGQAWPAFQERGFDGFRAYYRYVPKGTLTTEYTIRLNQAGRFALPATRVEALYAPEMFGELPNAALEVAP